MKNIQVGDKEVWRDIEGFEDYQISSYGRVKSKERLTHDNGGYFTKRERILKTDSKTYRYPRAYLYKDGKRYMKKVHRLVAEAFIPNLESKPEINHKDADKKNNHVDNLEWCTRKENVNHLIKLTGHNKGERAPRAKLTWVDVNEIRSRAKSGELYKSIAKDYPTCYSAVCDVINYVSWVK